MSLPKHLEEIWKPVLNFEGYYEVSNLGRLRRIRLVTKNADKPMAPKYISLKPRIFGYVRTSLCKDGRTKGFFIHTLVLEAFVGPRPEGKECAHLDGKRDNNRLDNLMWTTRKENHSHKYLHGTQQNGNNNPFAKLTECAVKEIRKLRAAGEPLEVIASKFQIDQSNVSLIVNRKTWIHI